MDSILQALQGLALLVIPAVGYLAYQYVKLQQGKIANEIRRAEQEALSHRLSEAVSTAGTSTSQTIVGKRSAEGALSPEVATSAKETARQTAQKLLSPEDLRAVREQYQSEAAIKQLLDPLIEAACISPLSRDTQQGAARAFVAALPSHEGRHPLHDPAQTRRGPRVSWGR